jgi:hypothetical protein
MVLYGPSENGKHQHKSIKVTSRVGAVPTTQKPQRQALNMVAAHIHSVGKVMFMSSGFGWSTILRN